MAAAPRIPGLTSAALLAGAVLGIPSTLGLVLRHQLGDARRTAFLPRPGYAIDVLAGAAGGGGRPLEVAFLGDSLVEGVGAPTAADSLPAQTASHLAAHLGRPVRMRGHGIACSRIADVITQQVPQIDPATDVVVVLIGANDATHGTAPWDFASRVEALALAAHLRTGGAPVVFTGLPELEAAPLLSRPLRDVAAVMGDTLHAIQRRIAVRVPHARYIDVRPAVGPAIRAGGRSLFAEDRYHPNAAGYALLATAIARGLADLAVSEGWAARTAPAAVPVSLAA